MTTVSIPRAALARPGNRPTVPTSTTTAARSLTGAEADTHAVDESTAAPAATGGLTVVPAATGDATVTDEGWEGPR
ncbi:hypothetical protein [Halorubellus sp. PRR65]|uniref:hypothetical protein n=1 Tax=Halorubellus sp. PRR65 TaxID=3098148 RepID=UPI002B256BB5|nr:hypothetical protein [Halorubellus sp. PRR65]